MSSETIRVLVRQIERDKDRIFREHPRSVQFRFSSKWYAGIRVAQMSERLDMMRTGYNPDTDTVLKINYLNFIGADGSTPTAPDVNDRIRMDNIDWRVEERIGEADDLKLVLRKETPRA